MNIRRTGQTDLPTSHRADEPWRSWDRREIIAAAGAVFGTAAGLAVPGAAAAAAPPLPKPFHLVIADTRFAEARAFAAQAERAGNRVARIGGDITALWYGELDLLWRRKKAALAGLTGYGAFFCLERLGWDHGLRVAFKEEHRRTAAGEPALLLRWIIAPKPARRIEGDIA